MAGDQTAGAVDDDGVGDEFDPDVERADEVEDYTGGIPRPVSEPTSDEAQGTAGAGGAGQPSGFGDGDVADVDPEGDGDAGQLFVDVEALAAERDQLKELAVRLQADFENFRKRTNAQLVADVDRATGRLAEALLPVLDAAEAAYVQHPDEIGPLLNVMLGELRKHGLETLDLDGQPFDPGVAEAVAHEAGDGGDVVVADVLRSGYRWRGRTLRPAMVRTKD
jgi:molecular chaperone GrpE